MTNNTIEQSLETIWDALQCYAEDTLGDRIGHGEHEENDDENESQWQDVCEAMADIRDQLGLCSEVDKPENQPPARSILLYNCRPNNMEPDWRLYDAIEIHPIQNINGSPEQCEPEEAEHWCVFGHLKEGGLEDITDTPQEQGAEWLSDIFKSKLTKESEATL